MSVCISVCVCLRVGLPLCPRVLCASQTSLSGHRPGKHTTHAHIRTRQNKHSLGQSLTRPHSRNVRCRPRRRRRGDAFGGVRTRRSDAHSDAKEINTRAHPNGTAIIVSLCSCFFFYPSVRPSVRPSTDRVRTFRFGCEPEIGDERK